MSFDRGTATPRSRLRRHVVVTLALCLAALSPHGSRAGEVDVSGADELEVSPTTVAVTIDTRFPATLDDVLQLLTSRELFLGDDAVREVEEIVTPVASWTGAFAGITFPPDSIGDVRRLLRPDAAKDVNLSDEEHQRLVNAVGGATDPAVILSRFEPEFRLLLAARLVEYTTHRDAIDYRRPRGARNITGALRATIDRWEQDHLPFGDQRRRYRDRYFWVRREVAGTRVYSLAHLRFGKRTTPREVEARISVVEFYVSAEYDGSLLQIDLTAIPLDGEHALTRVEAAGHAISDRITGTLGGLKRPIARGRLAGTHRRQFRRLRDALLDAD